MCVLSSIFLTVSMSACFLPQNEGDKDNPTTQANIQPDTGDTENGGSSDSNVNQTLQALLYRRESAAIISVRIHTATV